MPGLFSQHLLLCPLTVTVCSRWMPGFYENKCQDSFPNIYCYVPWKSQFVLDGWMAFMKINAMTLFPTSMLCPLTVAVCSRWMPCVYFHKCQDSFPTVYCYVLWQSQFVLDGCLAFIDSFPNVYCYLPWQSQFVLDGCLAFIFINASTLFPTSTGMSPENRSLFSMDAWHLWK